MGWNPVNVIECDVDNEHYWIATMSLGSAIARRLLDTAMKQGRCPIGMSELALEMIEVCENWCSVNCSGIYHVDPSFRLEVWFTDPKDAMLFKLTHG